MTDLIIHNTDWIEFGGNFFQNVPILIQYKSTPLVEVVNHVDASFTTQLTIFNKDGVKLARVKGTQIYRTPDGEKSNLVLSHPDKMTVCQLDGKIIFEMRRQTAAALKGSAELYAPDGLFVRVNDAGSGVAATPSDQIVIGGTVLRGNRLSNMRVGIQIN